MSSSDERLPELPLSVVDEGLADEHQRSFESAYQLSEGCWRCEAAEPISGLGLCATCLSAVRDEGLDVPTAIEPGPDVDVQRRFVDSVGEFRHALQRRNEYRCSFVHHGADRWCGGIAIGTGRFTVDPPVLLRRGETYSLVVDGDAGTATITARSTDDGLDST